ncbi:MAG: VWA domain-containing protein [Desulfobacterales bacterium]|jgi:hypothetical protein|nr:VWA domain-containing protein [Desulfobacterales bacterium]
MLNLLLNFITACRTSNLRVSTSEVIDCARQLELIDVTDEDQFRATLRANFAKSRRDQRNFDRLYHLYFHEMRPECEFTPDTLDRRELLEILDRLKEQMENDPITQAILDFLSGNPTSYLAELQRVEKQEELPNQTVRSNLSQLSGRLEIMLRINHARNRLVQLQTDISSGESSGRRLPANHLADRLDTASAMITQEIRPYNDGLRQVKTYDKHYTDLGERSFASLTEKEIEEMREVIKQLVRKMKDMMSRRYASRSKGILDVKKTLRHAGKFQGVPMVIKYRDRPLRKTKIVALCDVSGSVWSAARFMLNMIYSMQDCFSDVKSFAFICGPTNITDIFEKNEVNSAIEKVLTDTDINFNALTDYGEMFYQFHRDNMSLLNKKTTLIIVGDGRSNYHNPREKLLEDLRAKCRRVIWLNPEPEQFWGTGDSEMNVYKAFCHEVRPCRNLNQLIDFIEDLVF